MNAGSRVRRGRRPLVCFAADVLALVLCALMVAAPALAQAPSAPVGAAATAAIRSPRAGLFSDTEGPVYRIGEIDLDYAEQVAEQPSLGEVSEDEFALGIAEDGYVGPRRGGQTVWVRLSELPHLPDLRVYASGLRELDEQLVAALNRRGLIGVYVAPHPDDIDPVSGADLRPPGEGRLRLVVYTGRVLGVRTFSAGARVHPDSRVNATEHQVIAANSPVGPAPEGPDVAGGEPLGRAPSNLLRKDQLDEYVAALNRHPGRRVDVALTPAREPGGVYVDYLVAEERPWRVYATASDTGTDETGEWHQRFGLVHTQVTGNDDVLQLDYVTAGFDEVHALIAAYEAPLGGIEIPFTNSVRWRLQASGSSYDASELGSLGQNFEGDQWQVGAQLIANVLQHEDLFIDVSSGARFWSVETDNAGFSGDADFFLPHIGVHAEQRKGTSTFLANVEVEHNFGAVADTPDDPAELLLLGRPDVEDEWTLLRWDAGLSFYLEPVLWPRAWENPLSPSSSTLAHEIAISGRGQFAFDERLVPQTRMPLGGAYTVRGYEQAVVAGDTAFFGRAEYRYHVPMGFDPDPRPMRLPIVGDFRLAPQQVYARPDWDLILRAFFDYGRVFQSGSQPGEEDETLAGAGVGLELVLRRNISLRADLGFALSDVERQDVETGDTEAHLSATVQY